MFPQATKKRAFEQREMQFPDGCCSNNTEHELFGPMSCHKSAVNARKRSCAAVFAVIHAQYSPTIVIPAKRPARSAERASRDL
jgi:hypothetical protein